MLMTGVIVMCESSNGDYVMLMPGVIVMCESSNGDVCDVDDWSYCDV